MQGKVCVVTGANAGIGKSIALGLARQGAEVVLACRNEERAKAARDEIASATGSKALVIETVDVSSLASVRAFGQKLRGRYERLDVLVNNAGAWWMDRRTSPDGFELQWATNVLGPHLLTRELIEPLKAARGRIVNVASTAAGKLDLADVNWERRRYSGMNAYTATKQANRMLTWSWAERLKGEVSANACSPGLVKTELNRGVGGFMRLFFALMSPITRTPEQGADTPLWLASAPEQEGVTGRFFVDRKEKPCKFRQAEAMRRLWDLCEGQLA